MSMLLTSVHTHACQRVSIMHWSSFFLQPCHVSWCWCSSLQCILMHVRWCWCSSLQCILMHDVDGSPIGCRTWVPVPWVPKLYLFWICFVYLQCFKYIFKFSFLSKTLLARRQHAENGGECKESELTTLSICRWATRWKWRRVYGVIWAKKMIFLQWEHMPKMAEGAKNLS